MSRLAAELCEITEEYWRSQGRPMLLSALGGRLSEEAREEKNQLHTTFGAYIRNELADRVRWVPLSLHGGGVAPKELTAGVSDVELEARVPQPAPRPAVAGRVRSPMIEPRLWDAFRQKPPGEKRIYVELPEKGRLVVHAIDQADEVAADSILIGPDDFPDMGLRSETHNPAAIGSAIRTWAQKHGVAAERIERSGPPTPLGVAQAHVSGGSGSLALFAEGLSVLTAEELSRVMLPADVVVGLIRRSMGG